MCEDRLVEDHDEAGGTAVEERSQDSAEQNTPFTPPTPSRVGRGDLQHYALWKKKIEMRIGLHLTNPMVCRTLLALCITVSLTLHKLVSLTLLFLYFSPQTFFRSPTQSGL